MVFFRKSDKYRSDWPELLKQRADRTQDERLRDFYLRSAFKPDTPLGQVSFVALDFETTGLNPRRHDIVSIGLVPFSLRRIYCREAGYWLVSPRKPLVEESVIIHGITHSDLDEAPDLKRILDDVLEAMAGKVTIAHFHRIEREFFDNALKARIGEGIRFPIIDTMEIEARVQHRESGGLLNRLRGRQPLSIRLADSRSRYGLPPYQMHHALSDAVATAELFQAQIAYHYSPETRLGELWV